MKIDEIHEFHWKSNENNSHTSAVVRIGGLESVWLSSLAKNGFAHLRSDMYGLGLEFEDVSSEMHGLGYGMVPATETRHH